MRQKNELAFGKIPAYCKYELFMERYRSGAEIIAQEIELSDDTTILDVGCGEGYMKYFLNDGKGKWFGIERWDERVKVCENLGYDITSIDLNHEPMPYADNTFDVVVASHVLEHLSDIPHALSEISRVLKDGGVLLAATPTKPPILAEILNFIHKKSEKEIGDTQNAFTASALTRFLKKHLPNFEVVDVRGFRIFSARKRLPLENSYAFYRVSTFLGRWCTILVPEVNVIMKKVGPTH